MLDKFFHPLQLPLGSKFPFPEQDSFVYDTAQFVAALCTRRAGKSSGLARRFIKTMQKFPKQTCRYFSLTRQSAKEILWDAFQEECDRQGVQYEAKLGSLTIKLKNGAKLVLYGADQKGLARRFRGVKSPAVAIDEVQSFPSDVLEHLVDDVLVPTMADFGDDAWLALSGTPGPIPRGLWHDITTAGIGGYSLHQWSHKVNPYIAKGFADKYRLKKGWDLKHPTWLREWEGIWVLDLESLLIKWDEKLNHYETLPPGNYHYITGIDIGWRDADALATLAWRDEGREIYLVEEVVTAGQDITSLALDIKANMKKFNPIKLPLDEGALGKKIAEELRRRHHIPVYPVDKQRKMENITFLNDYLRRGYFKAKRDSRFVKDSLQLQIDHDKTTPTKLVVKKGFHSDVCDAVIYSFRDCPAWNWEAPTVKPKVGTQAWADAEVDRMEQEAEEYFTNMENQEKQGY